MKIRSAVPENGCLIVLVDGKKNKKTTAKHIRICLLPEGGCVKIAFILYFFLSVYYLTCCRFSVNLLWHEMAC